MSTDPRPAPSSEGTTAAAPSPGAPRCAVCAAPADHVLHARTVRHQRADGEVVVAPRPWPLCGCCAEAVRTAHRAPALRRAVDAAQDVPGADLADVVGDAWSLLVALGQQVSWGRAPRPATWTVGVPRPRG